MATPVERPGFSFYQKEKKGYSMLPELFSIGPFTVYSYGLMTALGIMAAIWIGEHLIQKNRLAEDGFLFGMGIACVLTGCLYCRIKKVDFWKVFDLAVPLVALAQCIGRIGCFLAGCCYGRETDGPFGVVFHDSVYAPGGMRLFPVQLPVFVFFMEKSGLKKGMRWRDLYHDVQHRPVWLRIFARGLGARVSRYVLDIPVYFNFYAYYRVGVIPVARQGKLRGIGKSHGISF